MCANGPLAQTYCANGPLAHKGPRRDVRAGRVIHD